MKPTAFAMLLHALANFAYLLEELFTLDLRKFTPNILPPDHDAEFSNLMEHQPTELVAAQRSFATRTPPVPTSQANRVEHLAR